MPNSPRQLIRQGKVDQARIAFVQIRRDLHSHDIQEEFALMRAQIEFEADREVKTYSEIFKLYRHRALVCIAVQTMTCQYFAHNPLLDTLHKNDVSLSQRLIIS